jgi:hypothetical protein
MNFFSLLPLALQFLGWMLRWYGASEDAIRKYTELIEQAAHDSLISIQSKDRLISQRAAIAERIKAKEDQKNVP